MTTPAEPALTVHPRLRGQLAALAAGRVLVIGYYRSACRCGVAVGDLKLSWRTQAPGPDYVALRPVERVAIYLDHRLLDVMIRAEPELFPGGWFRPGTPSMRLTHPDLWIDFLSAPVVPRHRAV
jgi:hypothetical protein